MSRLTEFYFGTGTDNAGRKIDEIWAWNDDNLEEVHDYIQWLFPTQTPSAYSRSAPVLTDDDIAIFRSDPSFRNRLRRSFLQFLRFLGLSIDQNESIVESSNFEERCPDIWIYENHNWLRISRILISLRLFGLEMEANALFAWLSNAYCKGIIGSGDGHSRREAEVSFGQWSKNSQL